MFHEKNQQVYCENIALEDLAARYGTPLYVYSQSAIDKAFSRYQSAFAALNPLICFAVKANGNLHILRHLAGLGAGFDIVSGGELARVIAAGADARYVIFSGVGKSTAEIQAALSAGIHCFNVESLPELERINTIAASLHKKAPISLRINPNIDAKTHPYISTGLKANKFGIAHEQAIEACLYAATLPYVDLIGIDCHIGSQLIDLSPLIEAAERMIQLIDQLKNHGMTLYHLDLGGGVGIRYDDEIEPNLEAYAQALKTLIGKRDLKLILEPGRSMIGNAAVLLTQVEYIKTGTDKNFVIVDAAMNDLMRPALYDAYHDIVPIRQQTRDNIIADVVGPICETGDFLGKNRQLAVAAGDILAIKSAGAYGMSMASQYNARVRPAEVMVSNHASRLIRRRENHEDLWQTELDLPDTTK